MSLGPGTGRIESDPWNRPAMYSRTVPRGAWARGLGPSRLAREEVPLPLAM